MSTTSSEEWTIGRLLTWTADYLKKQGADSPRLDAEVLLAHARGCKRLDLYTAFGDMADDSLRTAFRELVRRRAQGTPVAYLVGHREFYSLSFQVTPAVLIPRPETEFVVIEALDRLKQGSATDPRVVDVGTGSGAIAVSIAKHAPQAQVTAVDVSESALEVAGRNVAAHGLAERVELVLGDLLSSLPPDRKFEMIVSNPPYVTEAEYGSLAKDVKDYEPRLALVGGPEGTEIIERLVQQAAERLEVGGWLIMEISPMIVDKVKAIVERESRLQFSGVTKDLAGFPRVVIAQRVAT